MALDLQPGSLFHTDVQTQQHSLSYSVGLPAALPAVEGCSKAELVGASGVGGGYPKISNQADCNTDCTALDYPMALLLSQHLKQKRNNA